MMRRLHLMVGVAGTLIFLATGQMMAHHTPPMAELSETARLLYRSRHIYILAGALVNLMAGLYLLPRKRGWRANTQVFGSILVLASPALLLTAFLLEPQAGFRQEMWWSSGGLYLLFGGSTAHLVSGCSVRPDAMVAA